MLSKRFAPYPPESGSITFLIFSKGGLGGCPAAGGKGGKHFACPLVLVATFADDTFFVHDNYSARNGYA